MKRISLVLLAMMVLLFSALALAQESRPQNDREKEEKLKQFGKAFEKVEHDLKVSVTGKDEYHVAERIDVDISLTNTGSEILGAYVWNQYLQEELSLKQDGKPVKYRPDEDVTFEGRIRTVDVRERPRAIPPQVTTKIRAINLLDWYKKLEPGNYELTVGHRFWGFGKPIKSNTLSFKIVT